MILLIILANQTVNQISQQLDALSPLALLRAASQPNNLVISLTDTTSSFQTASPSNIPIISLIDVISSIQGIQLIKYPSHQSH
jgi:hypothetical protein